MPFRSKNPSELLIFPRDMPCFTALLGGEEPPLIVLVTESWSGKAETKLSTDDSCGRGSSMLRFEPWLAEEPTEAGGAVFPVLIVAPKFIADESTA